MEILDKVKALHVLIVADIVLNITQLVTSLAMEQQFPPALQTYLNEQTGAMSAKLIVGYVLLGIMMLGLMIPGYIGLWMAKRWGRLFYSGAVAVSIFAVLILWEPTVQSPIEEVFNQLVSILEGLILALTWFGMPQEFGDPAPTTPGFTPR